MTIVWYLGWARHEQNVAAPAAFLDKVVLNLIKESCRRNYNKEYRYQRVVFLLYPFEINILTTTVLFIEKQS